MANYDVLKLDGTKSGSIELSDAFGIEPNKRSFRSLQRASLRQGTHAVKNRSAVSGGGRKPWKQRNRSCSSRYNPCPQWRGGGIVFGPTQEVMHTKCLRKCVV